MLQVADTSIVEFLEQASSSNTSSSISSIRSRSITPEEASFIRFRLSPTIVRIHDINSKWFLLEKKLKITPFANIAESIHNGVEWLGRRNESL